MKKCLTAFIVAITLLGFSSATELDRGNACASAIQAMCQTSSSDTISTPDVCFSDEGSILDNSDIEGIDGQTIDCAELDMAELIQLSSARDSTSVLDNVLVAIFVLFPLTIVSVLAYNLGEAKQKFVAFFASYLWPFVIFGPMEILDLGFGSRMGIALYVALYLVIPVAAVYYSKERNFIARMTPILAIWMSVQLQIFSLIFLAQGSL